MVMKRKTPPTAATNQPATAIGYIRVSTQEQAMEGVSLAAQREKITAYCQLHGLELTHIHADEGLSAKRADNRPGLQDAITQACETGGVLVVYALSRLARSTRDAIDIADKLAKHDAHLVSITERIDTTTGMGRFFFTTMAALAQLERDQISERTAMAMAHKKAKGQRTGGNVPYGYRLAPDGQTVVPDETEQATVARILAMSAGGMSTREVNVALLADGVKPRTGKHWHPKVVMEIRRRSK
jgi:site-specific DNA recombinase